MRIGILLGYGVRGSGSTIYAMDLARSLAQIGHEVHLLCHEPDPSRLSRHGEIYKLTSWGLRCEDSVNSNLQIHSYLPEVVPVTYPRPEIPFGTLLSSMDEASVNHYVDEVLSWIEAVHSEVGFDLLLANHLALLSVAASRFHIKRKVPYRIIVHGTGLVYGVHKSEVISRHVTKATRHAERIIVLNDSVEKRVLNVFPELEERCLSIPPGTDTRRFSFSPNRPTPPKIAYIGRVTMDKGLHCLLAAMPGIVTKIPGLQVNISGNGADFEGLRTARTLLESGRPNAFLDACESLAETTRSTVCANKLLRPLRTFAYLHTQSDR